MWCGADQRRSVRGLAGPGGSGGGSVVAAAKSRLRAARKVGDEAAKRKQARRAHLHRRLFVVRLGDFELLLVDRQPLLPRGVARGVAGGVGGGVVLGDDGRPLIAQQPDALLQLRLAHLWRRAMWRSARTQHNAGSRVGSRIQSERRAASGSSAAPLSVARSRSAAPPCSLDVMPRSNEPAA